jgi:tripartite-type tricarboxylate transporter receptor subunit TctC
MAPAKTPSGAVAQLADWFRSAVTLPDLKPKLMQQGLYPVVKCGDEFAAHLRKQFEAYGRVIREANMKVQ